MKDFDNLSEISVEFKDGETLIEYWANSIPRINETISYKDNYYKVYNVIHRIVEHTDEPTGTYIIINVKLI